MGAVEWSLGGVLLAIAGLNVYWAAGGNFGRGAAVPSVGGRPLFAPSISGKVLTAAAFACAAALTVSSWHPALLRQLTHGLMFVVFALRAMGDGRYFGLFKSVRGTPFAIWDSRVYVPLSFMIAGASLYLAITIGHDIEASS